MKLNGQLHQSLTLLPENAGIRVLDQRLLPWEIKFVCLATLNDVEIAITDMWVRGAPLIGAVAAYGLCFALKHNADDETLIVASNRLLQTRPTAVNLQWAISKQLEKLRPLPPAQRYEAALTVAAQISAEDILLCKAIGAAGLELIQKLAATQNEAPLNILTHCNAGWLATVDYGTALAPIYMAHDAGIPLHIWVDETRPRNQGALTAFELAQHGIPHTYITDNAGGLLMRQGKVDLCIVGADRVARNGDVCNKIGTYLKALAAKANNIPFYAAVPYSTLDPTLANGNTIPIEERDTSEVKTLYGPPYAAGNTQKTTALINTNVTEISHPPYTALQKISLTNANAYNPAFDVTPAELITGYFTERGTLKAHELFS